MGKAYGTAIVLAAGNGTRMGYKVKKQYLSLDGKPVLYYSLKTFQDSDWIDEIILVVGKEDIAYCQEQIVKLYGFSKVSQVIAGGNERYESVEAALSKVKTEGYVYIHDGVRPFITAEILDRVEEALQDCDACVVGMPVKDTVKLVDANEQVKDTPDRDSVWMAQTPQVFETSLIKQAYEKLTPWLKEHPNESITDDACVVEKMLHHPVKMVLGSYDNIKITTPEDLKIAEGFAEKRIDEEP